jgi:hypothetical protein
MRKDYSSIEYLNISLLDILYKSIPTILLKKVSVLIFNHFNTRINIIKKYLMKVVLNSIKIEESKMMISK